MAAVSSPITYREPTLSPIAKRPRQNVPDSRRSRAVGGFMVDDDSDSDNETAQEEPTSKRRMLEKSGSPSPNEDDEISQESTTRIRGDGGGQTTIQSVLDSMLQSSTSYESESTGASTIPMPVSGTLNTEFISALPSVLSSRQLNSSDALTCSGKSVSVPQRRAAAPVSFEELIAARSTTKAGRATRSYYGIDIHNLIEESASEAKKETKKLAKELDSVLPTVEQPKTKSRRTLMWTEKYRARHFMELVGDDRTHRQVLKWLKAWDPLVFPKSGKAKPVAPKHPNATVDDDKTHRKILLLTGPPGLGKTTLAHVCARQAGYEIMEINASDERSKDVVKGRIRTSVGTESVKTGSTVTTKSGRVQKNAHPLCVVVDEVDGVVGGSGGSGEGGFVKALIDLIQLDQKNSAGVNSNPGYAKKKKKGDDFRLMRPLILICNDVYHPSLRPLRHSNLAEIIHIRKPPINAVIARMKAVFEKEGVSCDNDAVRRLCEATWGVSATDSRKGREGTGEGDLRAIMVVGEWAAAKLKASSKDGKARLTRKWVDQNMTADLSHGGGGARGVGRGGAKELVNRVFLEGAGFPKPSHYDAVSSVSAEQPKSQLGVAELAKKFGMDRLRELVDTNGEVDRIVTDIWSQYPSQPFNDDSILSKPHAAYEWLHFHDACSSRVFTRQEFELAPYLSHPVLACHHLFASPARHYFGQGNDSKKWGEEEEAEEVLPFSGPRADYEAFEAEKTNRATIVALQATLNPPLLRSFRSPEDIATDLLPSLVKILTPEVKPIIVGGSGEQKGIASVRKEAEKAMVKRAVDVMGDVGVIYERGKLDGDFGSRATQWVYRMEPPLDMLVTFETTPSAAVAPAPVRYAVRQVLDQEYQKNIIVRENTARQARYRAGDLNDEVDFAFTKSKEERGHHAQERVIGPKKDFFGRLVKEDVLPFQDIDGNATLDKKGGKSGKEQAKIWVTYHEGFSNAVRKPLTVEELFKGL